MFAKLISLRTLILVLLVLFVVLLLAWGNEILKVREFSRAVSDGSISWSGEFGVKGKASVGLWIFVIIVAVIPIILSIPLIKKWKIQREELLLWDGWYPEKEL
jgi:hypothetical protein